MAAATWFLEVELSSAPLENGGRFGLIVEGMTEIVENKRECSTEPFLLQGLPLQDFETLFH